MAGQVALFVALADGGAFVVLALAFGQGQGDFDLVAAKIDAQGDEGVALFVNLAVEALDLVLVQEEFADAKGVVVAVVGKGVFADVHLVDEDLAVFDAGVGVLDVHAAKAHGLDLGAF